MGEGSWLAAPCCGALLFHAAEAAPFHCSEWEGTQAVNLQTIQRWLIGGGGDDATATDLLARGWRVCQVLFPGCAERPGLSWAWRFPDAQPSPALPSTFPLEPQGLARCAKEPLQPRLGHPAQASGSGFPLAAMATRSSSLYF